MVCILILALLYTSTDLHSRNCSNRSNIVEAGTLEIPETPECTPAYDESTLKSPAISATKQVSTFWLQSELVSSKQNIVKKNAGDDEALCASNKALENMNELGAVTSMSQAADLTEQVLVRESDLAGRADPSQDDMPEKETLSARDKATFSSCPGDLADKSYASLPLPTTESSVKSTKSLSSIEFPDGHNNDPVMQHAHMLESESLEEGSMQPDLIASELMRSSSMTRSSSASRPPTDSGSESPPVFPEKRYTVREMARIALVAGNGAYLTTSQIVDWIATTFPQLLKGDIEWEKGLVSQLSSKQEFCGQEITGVQGKERSWGFADTKVRARYEREYATYHSGLDSATQMLKKSLATIETVKTVKQVSREDKKVLSRHMIAGQRTPTHAGSAPNLPTSASKAPSSTTEALVSPTKRNDSRFMPFERSTPRESQSLPKTTYNIKRETSLYKIYLQNQQLPVEAMKSGEKAAKIAEIQRRPSRKHFFGSDHRLAHVRRYGRQDIHDESDGAWRLGCSNGGESNSRPDKDVAMGDSQESCSLREVFDLPDNAIPMNEGQTELAFRDGTLASALPVHVY